MCDITALPSLPPPPQLHLPLPGALWTHSGAIDWDSETAMAPAILQLSNPAMGSLGDLLENDPLLSSPLLTALV